MCALGLVMGMGFRVRGVGGGEGVPFATYGGGLEPPPCRVLGVVPGY